MAVAVHLEDDRGLLRLQASGRVPKSKAVIGSSRGESGPDDNIVRVHLGCKLALSVGLRARVPSVEVASHRPVRLVDELPAAECDR